MSAFEVAVLASGSKGNATAVCYDGWTCLVDMGISCRQTLTKLKQLGLKPEALQGVFLTHEHSDHVRGLMTFAKRYEVPIYASAGTWTGLPELKELLQDRARLLQPRQELEGLSIKSFPVSHDALEPVGYTFEVDTHKFAYVTDTGFINQPIKEAVQEAEVLLVEANHDLEMLRTGSYPQVLKKRILGTKGHLANTAAGWLLAGLPHLPQDVFLAHLSQENNRPELALATVSEIVHKQREEAELNIYVASQEQIIKNYQGEDFYEKNIFE